MLSRNTNTKTPPAPPLPPYVCNLMHLTSPVFFALLFSRVFPAGQFVTVQKQCHSVRHILLSISVYIFSVCSNLCGCFLCITPIGCLVQSVSDNNSRCCPASVEYSHVVRLIFRKCYFFIIDISRF
jgi:hypothetical protein